MNTRILIPHPALRPYIKNYMYFEVGAKDKWTKTEISPSGVPIMSVAIGKDQLLIKEFGRLEPLLFCGQFTENRQMHAYGKTRMFYIFFRPVGAYQLLYTPQKGLKNKLLNLSDLLGGSISILKEKLAEQTTIANVRQIVEAFFLKRLSQQKMDEAAMQLAYSINQIGAYSHKNNIIKKICLQQGYSISRLERHMQQMTGIGPKMLQRIVRFNKALEYISLHRPPYHWAQIAHQFGYYDQMHFIKDFSCFYGTTPGSLAAFDSKLQLSLDFSGEVDSGKSLYRAYSET